MTEPFASASADQIFRATNWKAISEELTQYATRYLRTRPQIGAGDVVQAAIEKVLAGTYAWDVERVPDLRVHLRNVVNSIVANTSTCASERSRAPEGDASLDALANEEPSPESTVHNRRLVAVCADVLEEKLGARGAAYLRLLEERPKDQAIAMGLRLEEVYRLRESAVTHCRNALLGLR